MRQKKLVPGRKRDYGHFINIRWLVLLCPACEAGVLNQRNSSNNKCNIRLRRFTERGPGDQFIKPINDRFAVARMSRGGEGINRMGQARAELRNAWVEAEDIGMQGLQERRTFLPKFFRHFLARTYAGK